MKRTLTAFMIFAVAINFHACSDNDNGIPTSGGTPSGIMVTVAPATFTQGVGLTNIFTATVSGASDNSVTWAVNGIPGGDNATVGGISVGGRYYAPDNVPNPSTVTVKATSVEDPTVYGTAQVTIVSGNGTGLQAAYSTGPTPLEGPIFHGYWTDCGAVDDHNYYQGQCTPLADSPVNWSWGSGWTVTWTGQLFVPFTGNYRFASRYWVDDIVNISVNNTVVANINTTGANYDQTLALTGNTWVPVSMSFTSNGGSNNIHLAWISPGGEWRPVAKSFLKP